MVRPTDPGSRCPHLMDPGSGHPIQGQIQDGVPDVVLRMTTLGVTSHLRSAIVHCVISIALPAGLRGPTGTPHTHAGRGTGGCEDLEPGPSMSLRWVPGRGPIPEMGYPRSVGSGVTTFGVLGSQIQRIHQQRSKATSGEKRHTTRRPQGPGAGACTTCNATLGTATQGGCALDHVSDPWDRGTPDP